MDFVLIQPVNMTDGDPYNATLIERRDIHDALAVFKVRYDSGGGVVFEPGQFTTLALVDHDAPGSPTPRPGRRRRGPKMIRRAYTIVSAAQSESLIEFYVARIDAGRLTPQLWRLKPDDRLFMDTKIKGTFTLDDIPRGKHLIAVGTSVGIAPYLAMLNRYRGMDRWNKFVLIESCRSAKGLGYREALGQMAEKDDSVVYLPTLTRESEDSSWQGLRGRVRNILTPEVFKQHTGIPLDPAHCHVLLCGNPDMIDQATNQLTEFGFILQDRDHPEGNIHTERYW